VTPFESSPSAALDRAEGERASIEEERAAADHAEESQARMVTESPGGTRLVVRFSGDGRDFSATRDAEDWLRANGCSVGPMQADAPRAIMFGDYQIAKWRNLSGAEKAALDGLLECAPGTSPRNGPVIVRLRCAPPGPEATTDADDECGALAP
jgi:hypothetical protein